MIARRIFSDEHELFRDGVKRFLEAEVAPRLEEWEARSGFDRSLFERAAAAGLLCPAIPAEYGGAGADRLYSAVVLEACAPYSNIGLSLAMHSDIVASYLLHYGSEDLKRRWLPKMAAGETIGALGMSEPGAGSDVKAIRTTAVREGGEYVISGSKIFISNGSVADLVVVVARTDPSAGAKGISLLLVEADRPGFTRGRRLKKIGLKSQDTAELFFDKVRVPIANLIGEENQGFAYSMQELPWERLQIAIAAVAAAEEALRWTTDYVRERRAFGQHLIDLQTVRFTLAELKTEVQIGRVFVDRCIEALLAGTLDATEASMAKYWTTELQARVVDAGVQLHGGYGVMWEYPIARAFVDARAQRIYGGTNEIMKELISRRL